MSADAKAVVKEIDLGWKRIQRTLALIRQSNGGAVVKIGVLGESAAKDHGGLSMVELAAIHEFGAPGAGVPARSFLREPVDAKRAEYRGVTRELLRLVVEGQMDLPRALGLLGLRVESDLKAHIRGGIPPQLAPETIARKGSSTPLVDSGQLLRAITHAVEVGGRRSTGKG